MLNTWNLEFREHLKEDNQIPVEQNFFTIQEKFEQNLWSTEEVNVSYVEFGVYRIYVFLNIFSKVFLPNELTRIS